MAKKRGRRKQKSHCKYHPPRTSGRQKLLRVRAYEEHIQKKKKDNTIEKSIDTSRSDWSSE